ncbi:hypothetical protein [Hyphobacterium sp.]|uniref:hypothetical protein n=1 Tax=Hyphobacterium sp. TaxID=2004662 RepID=UPI003BAD410B
MAKIQCRVVRGTFTRGKPGNQEEFTAADDPFTADEAEVRSHIANGDIVEVKADGSDAEPSRNEAHGLPKSLEVDGDLDAPVALSDGEGAPTVPFGAVVFRAWKDFKGKVVDFNKADQEPLFDAALEALRKEAG